MRISLSTFFGCLASSSILSTAVAQTQCTVNTSIDNYAQWSSSLNTLGGWTSDDGTMSVISAASGKLSFTPKSDGSSYFYTTFDCIAAPASPGTAAITFSIKGPAGSSFLLEIQVSPTCSDAYTSRYVTVSAIPAAGKTVTVALLPGEVVQAFAWMDFTQGAWELGQTQLLCASSATTPSSATTSAVSSLPVSSVPASSVPASSAPVSSAPASSVPASSTTSAPTSTPSGTCKNLLIDDWASQSRLTFLYYNAMLEPSSDDGTMSSVVVSNNRVTLTPGTNSYFYSQFDCISATSKYGGISLRIKAPAGTTFTVELQTNADCTTNNPVSLDLTTTQLGWTFDGTEKVYNIAFSKYSGLDTGKLVAILFQSFSTSVTMGPMAFYCGTTISEYTLPATTTAAGPTATVPATSATATPFVIDNFSSADTNTLGQWHGGDDATGMSISGGKLTINFSDSDYSFYTQLTGTCRDMTAYSSGYLHIAFTGSAKFSIALQQHNSACDSEIAPFPETWDEVYAERYFSNGHVYIPISHFNIVKTRVIGVALKGFTGTASTVFSLVEIVRTAPSTYTIPSKLATAPLVFACTRPNSFAFAIDDGQPELAQQVLETIRAADIKVTFFTVGAALLDPSTNLSNVYNEMLSEGHQVALHSYTHPKMEGLQTLADIDWEIDNDVAAVQQTLGISSSYFRPPFGNVGARFRERIAAKLPGGKLINWSVDVQDWLWGESSTPEKQLEAFSADLAKGGNLVVLHYLYPSTVQYLPQFIALAKATGKQLMRVDQCLEDPNAPAL